METNREYQATEEEEIASIDYELREIEARLASLNSRRDYLQQRREKLKDDLLLKKSDSLAKRDWSRTDFPWSKELQSTLETKFKINEFRPYQVPTINAVLSEQDVILIMPTGGGKSLCYQLPALIKPGLTLVVSPLVSLMEDQLMALEALNINAALLNSTSCKFKAKEILNAMIDKESSLKLLYVTPEKLAKSKMFMSRLQKAHALRLLSLIAIDEVHCCSQWGHDFRPDYKFLGLLKSMFPEVPVLGLTATATSKVIVDVQKMLSIQGCLVLKASFNRPNLYYEIQPKPSVQKEGIEKLVELLKGRYANQSGIIYSTTVKDCEELTSELQRSGLRVGRYHAQLEPPERSHVHAKWASGKYQAVIATIAFGMGIDKPNVRFVIHYSLSKSMENFYQESGRAGRDNQPADCIMFYRFGDVFKLSTMVFSQQTGLDNLYGIINYCLDSNRCRRSIIASYFQESWESTDCNAMCDHCRQPREDKEVDVAKYCRNLYQLMANAAGNDVKLTGQKLMDAWFGKGPTNLRVKTVPVPAMAREAGEAIVMHLLTHGYLKEDFSLTPYTNISYITKGPKGENAVSGEHKIIMKALGRIISKSIDERPANKLSKCIDMVESEEPSNLAFVENEEPESEEPNNLALSSTNKCAVAHNDMHESNHGTPEINKLPNQQNQWQTPSTQVDTDVYISKLFPKGITLKEEIVDLDLDESSNNRRYIKRKFIFNSKPI